MVGIKRLFCASLCLFACLTEADSPIDLDIVLDMDETLIFRDIQNDVFYDEVTPPSHQISSDGERYRFGSGAGELIQFLDLLPSQSRLIRSVRLHFASAYNGSDPRKRMKETLATIALPDGRRTLEIAQRLFYHEDLAPAEISIPEQWASLPFSFEDEMLTAFLAEHKKKNLALWFEDTTNVILLDDNPGWVHPTQFKHWVPVFNKSTVGELARVAAIIENAVRHAEQYEISVPESLFYIQWQVRQNEAHFSSNIEDPIYFKRGERLFQRYQGKFSLSRPIYYHCTDFIRRQS